MEIILRKSADDTLGIVECPPGVSITVRNYNCLGIDADMIDQDEAGDNYWVEDEISS